MSEVKAVTGYVGNFQVQILKKARYVNEKECTACGDCAQVCPVVVPDEFNMGLCSRKAIYSPFPQAVPSAYVIDIDDCLGHNPVVCGKCIEKCQKKCIDFDMSDEELSFKVGTIVVATGMEPYDPTELDEYGYTRFENVLTAPGVRAPDQCRRTDPGRGRAADRRKDPQIHRLHPVRRLAVPAARGALLLEHLLHEHGQEHADAQGALLRTWRSRSSTSTSGPSARGSRTSSGGARGRAFATSGGCRDRFKKTRKARISSSRSKTRRPHQLENHRAEMVVLAVGVEPPEDMKIVQEMLALQKTSDGFFLEAHPKLQPVDSATRGIFFAGCAEGPKDIKESVTQASAAAARAIRLMHPDSTCGSRRSPPKSLRKSARPAASAPRSARIKAITVDTKAKTPARVTDAACAGCGTCAAECPFGAILMNHFTDEQIEAQIDAILEEDPAERIARLCLQLVLLCGRRLRRRLPAASIRPTSG